MWQRRWMELIRDYDMDIIYHEGKENVVADVLSRKSVHSLCTNMSLMRLRDEVGKMGIHVVQKGDARGDLTVEQELYDDICQKHALDPRIRGWRAGVGKGTVSRFSIYTDRSVQFDGRWYRKHVVRLYEVPKDIVLDRDARFIYRFWQDLQEMMGTTLKMSTAFYPGTDGKT
ncbi:uncharacterized protein LOC141628349 [Silene latifolia]|uniref:uncharacterized protein LOC141628349 n=1 Tax=Silene latifolia TaxID=37657 RepID=UPI003D788AF2